MPDALTLQETEHINIEGEAELKVVSLDGHHQGDNAERSSKIAWLYDKTSTHLLEEIVYRANLDAAWLFDLTRPEAVQYTTYETGDEYSFHSDGNQDRYAVKQLILNPSKPMPLNQTTNPLLAGLVRKLSVSVNLSSPEDYEGGNLQLRYNNQTWEIDSPPIGSAIVFPSFIEHRITPVTKGIRKSAVMWFNGPPIR